MGRRAAREFAMKILYQLEIQKENRQEQIRLAMEEEDLTEKDKLYIHTVFEGVHTHMEYLDKLIEKNLKGWNINRISKVDLSILRLGIFEICFMADIPYSVSVNEAVELSKKYSGEEAGAFINGIMSKIPKMQCEVPPSRDSIGVDTAGENKPPQP